MQNEGFDQLQEREKAVLRLLLQGFDVKASARELSISANVVNERLRDARRKLGVTSSKEAARILARNEADTPNFLGNRMFGIADPVPSQPDMAVPEGQARESEGALHSVVRENQVAFNMFALASNVSPPLSHRRSGGVRNELNKRERVSAIIDVTTKLAAALALVCLIAMSVNTIIQRF
jgi:DNA-binding CsgD family transcriptional regulator